jgi:hypothetical protein
LASITGGQPGPNPFTFRGLTLNSIDCPRELSIGTGEQKMVQSPTVGGGLVTHIIGFYPDLNTWGGTLHQPGIQANFDIMQGWMVDGKEGLVTWKTQQYYGIVKKFTPNFRHGGNLCDWKLEVAITRAANGAFSLSPTASVDATVSTLFDTVNIANTIIQQSYGTTPIGATPTAAQSAAQNFNTSLGLTSDAVTKASPLASANGKTIAAAQAAVSGTQSTVPAMLSAFPAGSAEHISAAQINTALTVINGNLASTQTQASIQLQGGSLLALAATKYGDPSKAYDIMTANGLFSPTLPGSRSTNLKLPPLAGIFNDGSSTYSKGIVGG